MSDDEKKDETPEEIMKNAESIPKITKLDEMKFAKNFESIPTFCELEIYVKGYKDYSK